MLLGQKNPFRFLDLAGEVRNTIYRYALTASHNNPQKHVWSGLDPHEGQTYILATGLLRVNRQVYREASSIFYRENGFVLVRYPHNDGLHDDALALLLERSVPAIAMTRKVSECYRTIMIYQFGEGDIETSNYLGVNIVLAAKDFELFVLIALEMLLSELLPLGIKYAIRMIDGLYVSFKDIMNAFSMGWDILEGLKMALTDDVVGQHLSYLRHGPQFRDSERIVCKTLSERVECKVADGSYASAVFYYQKLEEYWVRALYQDGVRQWHHAIHVIEWKQRHAEALRKAGNYRKAHEVIKSAIAMWNEEFVPGMTPGFLSELCCLRARLDEVDGSLTKMRDAKFWFEEALRVDPTNTALSEDIERVETEIFIHDDSNW